jgi:hypothetical protein
VIVLGIDPGAVHTGLALIDAADFMQRPALIESRTVTRDDRLVDEELLDVPDAYLLAVCSAAVEYAVRIRPTPGVRAVHVVGIEGIRRPSWRHAGKVKPVDPSAFMATGIVLGALRAALAVSTETGRIPVKIVRPLGNGRLFPLNAYPDPLATDGKGHDARRHERSAYDVAVMVNSKPIEVGETVTVTGRVIAVEYADEGDAADVTLAVRPSDHAQPNRPDRTPQANRPETTL